MFGIGGGELLVILLFAFLILGPEKLPEIARSVGKGIAKFRAAQEDMNEVIRNDVYDPTAADPIKENAGEGLEKLANTAEKHLKNATSGMSSSKEETDSSSTVKAKVTPREGGSASATGASAHKETFTERKARYERERAERLAKEAKGGTPAKAGTAAAPAPAAATAKAAPAPESKGGEQ